MRKLVAIWMIVVVFLSLGNAALVTAADKPKSGRKDKAVIRIFTLQNAKTSDAKDLLSIMFGELSSNTTIVVKEGTNQLVVSVPPDALKKTEKAIEQIDALLAKIYKRQSAVGTRSVVKQARRRRSPRRSTRSSTGILDFYRMFPPETSILDVHKDDEKRMRIADLEQRSRQLAEEYKVLKGSQEKQTVKADLKGVLSEIFSLKQEDRKNQISRLEKELARLRATITKREKNKKAIATRRLNELTGEAQYLEW